ncbi:unnamed protein product [Arctia plantaginis]|uniref:Secreted protein n=1 Tax=Arctia plantaginis TaxID=874455 RepID=A0A8S0ZV20_ARCPL|nr:unnamed protein product [Arctia plantaginis]
MARWFASGCGCFLLSLSARAGSAEVGRIRLAQRETTRHSRRHATNTGIGRVSLKRETTSGDAGSVTSSASPGKRKYCQAARRDVSGGVHRDVPGEQVK